MHAAPTHPCLHTCAWHTTPICGVFSSVSGLVACVLGATVELYTVRDSCLAAYHTGCLLLLLLLVILVIVAALTAGSRSTVIHRGCRACSRGGLA